MCNIFVRMRLEVRHSAKDCVSKSRTKKHISTFIVIHTCTSEEMYYILRSKNQRSDFFSPIGLTVPATIDLDEALERFRRW